MNPKHSLLALLLPLIPLFACAQNPGKLPDLFKAEAIITGDLGKMGNATLEFLPTGETIMFALDASEKKKMGLPVNSSIQIRQSHKAFAVRWKRECYTIRCKGKDCRLIWWDRNKDGNIQPRQELRCATDSGNSCAIIGARAGCK